MICQDLQQPSSQNIMVSYATQNLISGIKLYKFPRMWGVSFFHSHGRLSWAWIPYACFKVPIVVRTLSVMVQHSPKKRWVLFVISLLMSVSYLRCPFDSASPCALAQTSINQNEVSFCHTSSRSNFLSKEWSPTGKPKPKEWWTCHPKKDKIISQIRYNTCFPFANNRKMMNYNYVALETWTHKRLIHWWDSQCRTKQVQHAPWQHTVEK